MEKKLIYTDRHAQAQFLAGVETARDRSNELIEIFNAMNEWQRIDSLKDFILLVTNPVSYFDMVMIQNLNTGGMGNGRPNPEALAQLYDIPRQSYINMIEGVYYDDPGCIPCGKVKKLRKGKPVIHREGFERYQAFLLFTSGSFTLNEEAIAEHSKSFETWAVTSGQQEIVAHWESLVNMLNTHDSFYPVAGGLKQSIAKGLGLMLTEAISGSFMISSETLKNLIYKK